MSAWADRVQGFGLYLTALSLFLAPSGVSAGLALIWLGFLLSLAARRPLPLSNSVWFGIAFGVYALINGAFPTLPDSTLSWRLAQAGDWVQLCVFLPAAYALRGDQHRLLQLLTLALIGLLLGMLWRLDWDLLLSDSAGFFGSRPGFGFPAIVFALISGVALIGLLVFRERFWLGSAQRPAAWRAMAWIAATAFVAQGFMLTLSRGAWIALAVTAVAAVWLSRRIRPTSLGDQLPVQSGVRSGVQSPMMSAALYRRSALLWFVGFLLLGLLAFNAGPFIDRFSQEQDAVNAMLSGNMDYSAQSSLSLRWHAQRFGLAAWLERPLFGWGPGASHAMMVASADPALQADGGGALKHLHNTYLELLVQLGLVGLLLWLGLSVCLLLSVLKAWRSQVLSPDLARFLILAIVYLSLWDLFDFHATHQDWRGLWALLAGAALSAGLFADSRADDAGGQRAETPCASH